MWTDWELRAGSSGGKRDRDVADVVGGIRGGRWFERVLSHIYVETRVVVKT